MGVNLGTILKNLDDLRQKATSLSNDLNTDLLQSGTADLNSLKSKMEEAIRDLDQAKTDITTIKTELDNIESTVKRGG